MLENLIKQLSSTPIALSGLMFPKTAEEISAALKHKRSEIGQSIETRRSRIQVLIEAENAQKRTSVDALIDRVESLSYLYPGRLTKEASEAVNEARAIVAERAVLEIVALADDHFDVARFDEDGKEELNLTFLDLKFLFEPFRPITDEGILSRLASAQGIGTMMEGAGLPAAPRAVSLADLGSDPNAS
jgi:hypothetical protein